MSRKASSSIADRKMEKSVGASTQPCLTPFVTLNDSETSPPTLTFVLSFHHARNRSVVNALHNKRTAHLSQLVSGAKGIQFESKKIFALINILCGKKRSSPLPD